MTEATTIDAAVEPHCNIDSSCELRACKSTHSLEEKLRAEIFFTILHAHKPRAQGW